MYKVGDVVMYRNVGLYKIDTIKKVKRDKKTKEYFNIVNIEDDNSTAMIPVDNTTNIRHLIQKDQIDELFDLMKDQQIVEVSDKRKRDSVLDELLKHNSIEATVAVIQTIYDDERKRKLDNKSLSMQDKNKLEKTEQNLYKELGYVLNIEEDCVADYIKEHIK